MASTGLVPSCRIAAAAAAAVKNSCLGFRGELSETVDFHGAEQTYK